MTKERFKIVPAVYLVLVNDNKVCLLKRSDSASFMPGKWAFPAGHLDGNETAREGMVREAKEELGIDISIDDLYEPLSMNALSEGREGAYWFFVCDKWDGDVINVEPNKASKIEWFEFDKLPEDLIEYQMLALESLMNGVKYLEYGWDK